MKRTPLKRTHELARTRMKPGKRKGKYARRERDWDYMGWVKTLPCLLARTECSGTIEADHTGMDSPMGQKAPDDTCVPLCSRHHRDRHDGLGFFRGQTREVRREWRLWAIDKTQAEYEAAVFFHGDR